MVIIIIIPVNGQEARFTHDMLVLEVAEIPKIVATTRYNNRVVTKSESGCKFQWRQLEIDTGFAKLMKQMKQHPE